MKLGDFPDSETLAEHLSNKTFSLLISHLGYVGIVQ